MRFGFSRSSGPPGPNLSATTAGAAAGAGFAAALMVVAVAKNVSGSVALDAAEVGLPPGLILPMIMILVVPLPLMIVAIGFGRFAGIMASLIGALAVGLFTMMPSGVGSLDPARLGQAAEVAFAFLLVFGLPAVLLAQLAVRRIAPPQDLAEVPKARPEERVLGAVVAAAIAYTAIMLSALFALVIEAQNGGFAAFSTEFVNRLKEHPDALKQLPASVDPAQLARVYLWLFALVTAGFGVATLLCNLWLAARIARTSSLLAEPWPDIARNLRLPRPLAIILAVALGLSFAGGLVGIVSAIVTGALLTGFVFQGLAVIHCVTMGNRLRLTLLTLAYFFLIVMPVPLIYALIGLLDVFFAFRDRQRPVVVRKKPQDHP